MKNKILWLVTILNIQSVYALPVDWAGVFSVDTTRLSSYSKGVQPQSQNLGSQVIPLINSDAETAHVQTYLLKLQPTIIVNDSATIFGEMTTGYARGGRWGQGLEQTSHSDRGMGNVLYNYQNYREPLHLSQIYAKYYANTATYVIGRQPLHWGLGAIFNNGEGVDSRFSSIEDGITAHLNIGNFRLSPYYMKANGSNLDGQGDLRHIGIKALYQNNDQGLSLGLLYSKRRNKSTTMLLEDQEGGIGPSEVRIIDLYFQKDIERFTVEAEFPVLTGSLGSSENTYSARALLAKASYELHPTWNLGLGFGYISGEDGQNDNELKALYLHPNYQVANLMFRYNLGGIAGENNESIFDSYMTNVQYIKIMTSYQANQWVWELGFVMANALKVAQEGQSSFHHEKNTFFTASENQEKSYGFEIDLDFIYKWNTDVSVMGSLGYHFVGEYYAFDNSSTEGSPSLSNPYAAKIQTVINF